MLEIAIEGNKKGVLQKDIAKQQGISVKYLDHIIKALKVAGLISNSKGKKSGYILTRDPALISMYDIHRAFEPGIAVVDCLDCNINCERQENCVAREFWLELNNRVSDYFKSIRLKDMIEKQLLTSQQSVPGN